MERASPSEKIRRFDKFVEWNRQKEISLSLSLSMAARTSQFRRPWPRVDGCCQRAKGAKGGRGRPRKEWWLGGKAISWEKGAGVTRARDSARGDASLRGAVTRASYTHASARGRSVWNTWSRPWWACVSRASFRRARQKKDCDTS